MKGKEILRIIVERGKHIKDVDHLVYGVPDLHAGIKYIEELLGVRAAPGGQHPGGGTRNSLISLGTECYLEIIGRDPEQPEPLGPRLFGLDNLSTPRLVTWAAKSNDLEKLESAGLGAVSAGSRKTPDGVLLAWRYTDPRTVIDDGIVPFFIDWGTTPHPASKAGQGAVLVGLRAEHPEAERVQADLRRLGLNLTVTAGTTPAIIATIESPRGRIELR